MYLVIDTETSGFGGKAVGPATEWMYQNMAKYATCRVIQIAIVCVDDQFCELNRFCALVNTPIKGYHKSHGIHDERRWREGVPFDQVAAHLARALPAATHIVAHNALFDVEIIAHELWLAGREDLLALLHEKAICCTMKVLGRVNLGKLYLARFGRPFAAHDALADTLALVELLAAAKPPIVGNVQLASGGHSVTAAATAIVAAPSEEQCRIRDAVAGGQSVIVSAVAGSGKTTVSLLVAQRCGPGLILTYNRQLAKESEARAKKAGLRCEIRTYHSFAFNYLSRDCYNDTGLIRALAANVLTGVPQYPFIVFDECQDMTPLLYRLAGRILAGQNCPLVIMGDPRQNIYRYQGSDPCYMTAEMWVQRQFVALPLSTSYRLTRPVAAMVTQCSGVAITAVKDGVPPHIECAAEPNGRNIANAIHAAWHDNPCGVLVLVPTVRKMWQMEYITSYLVQNAVPIFAAKDDMTVPSELQLRNKVGFITYHQAKGLERDVVFTFLDSHFTASWGGWLPHCPNEVYVALTRARLRQYVYSDFKLGDEIAAVKKELDRFTVTELCRHILPQILVQLADFVDQVQLAPAGELLAESGMVVTTYNGTAIVEDTAAITGVMIPAQYTGFEIPVGLSDKIGKAIPVGDDVASLCEKYLYYYSWVEDAPWLAKQIDRFDWITAETLAAAVARLDATFKQYDWLAEPERPVVFYSWGNTVNGRVDILGEYAWEIKYAGELTEVHRLQCALYSYATGQPGMLFNVRSGELVKITPRADFATFLAALFCAKASHGTIRPDRYEMCAVCTDRLRLKN
jgi:DNA polymerase III epsilon subunit-like protein